MSLRKLWPLFLVLVAYAITQHYFEPIAANDPDRYYHLALARSTSESGLVFKLPQAEDIQWGKRFPDKNFLFTLLTAGAYRWGGETAVLASGYLLTALFLSAFFGILIGYVPPAIAGLLISTFFLIPDFANRLCVLRPHLLALLAFALLVWQILRRNPLGVGLAGAFFALSYHAVYLPLFLIAVGSLAFREWRLGLAGLTGLCAGILAHPYFPLNLQMSWQTLSIAFNWNELAAADRPLENVALAWPLFLVQYAGFLALVVLAVVWIWRNRKAVDGEVLFALMGAVGLWYLSTITRRASEYAVPMSLLLASLGWRYRPRMVVVASVGLGLLQLPLAIGFYSRAFQPTALPLYALEAIGKIPKQAQGEKVFNCEWHNSPYLLYARPDLRFVDISDPALLFQSNSEKYAARVKLRRGEVVDPVSELRDRFHSQFVLCEARNLVTQLENDNRFVRLYPEKWTAEEYSTWKPFLYALKGPADTGGNRRN